MRPEPTLRLVRAFGVGDVRVRVMRSAGGSPRRFTAVFAADPEELAAAPSFQRDELADLKAAVDVAAATIDLLDERPDPRPKQAKVLPLRKEASS